MLCLIVFGRPVQYGGSGRRSLPRLFVPEADRASSSQLLERGSIRSRRCPVQPSVSFRSFWNVLSAVPATRDPEEQKQRLVEALESKGVPPTEARELVEAMWPVLREILDALRDVGALKD